MKSDYLLLLAFVLCVALFAGLAVHVAGRNDDVDRLSPPVDAIEVDIVRAVQDLPAPAGDVFAIPNRLGYSWPLMLVTAVAAAGLWWRSRPVEAGLVEAGLMALTLIPRALDDWFKYLIEAPRPTPDLVSVREAVAGYAYPSGHVVATTAVFVLLFVFAPRLRLGRNATLAIRAVAVFMVASVGLARLWQGVHWPSDIVGGYLFAAAWLIVMLRLHVAVAPADAADKPATPR